MAIGASDITHVIFDMDGVLLDTECFYTEATQQVVSQYGKNFEWSHKMNMMGLPAKKSARYLIDKLALPMTEEQFLQQRELLMEKLMPSAQPMPGAVALIESLSQANVPMAIATSSDKHFFDLKTQRNRAWIDKINVVVVGDDPRLQNGKPAPDIFLLAAQDLSAEASKCVVVEDSIAGVKAAHAANMKVVAVPYPGMDPAKLTEADLLVDSLESLRIQDLLNTN